MEARKQEILYKQSTLRTFSFIELSIIIRQDVYKHRRVVLGTVSLVLHLQLLK